MTDVELHVDVHGEQTRPPAGAPDQRPPYPRPAAASVSTSRPPPLPRYAPGSSRRRQFRWSGERAGRSPRDTAGGGAGGCGCACARRRAGGPSAAAALREPGVAFPPGWEPVSGFFLLLGRAAGPFRSVLLSCCERRRRLSRQQRRQQAARAWRPQALCACTGRLRPRHLSLEKVIAHPTLTVPSDWEQIRAENTPVTCLVSFNVSFLVQFTVHLGKC